MYSESIKLNYWKSVFFQILYNFFGFWWSWKYWWRHFLRGLYITDSTFVIVLLKVVYIVHYKGIVGLDHIMILNSIWFNIVRKVGKNYRRSGFINLKYNSWTMRKFLVWELDFPEKKSSFFKWNCWLTRSIGLKYYW